MPKNAKRAKITSIAPGLEIPMMTAWKKSFSEYDGVESSCFILRKGSLSARLQPRSVTMIPPPTIIRVL